MKLLQRSLLFGALAALLPSCADESPFDAGLSNGEGGLKVNLISSNYVATDLPNVRSMSTEVIAPESNDFEIHLSKSDGSFSKTWSSLQDFADEESFPVGTYKIEAIYGHEQSQGIVQDNERGHEHAYYYGITENVTVLEGQTTNVELVASLSNSVVVVEYTEAFKRYFKSWSTTLKTQGEESLELGDSQGTCYVIPGDVDVIIYAELQNGKSITLNPAVFTAEPQHLYKIKYNVYNGEIGAVPTLSITFNDDPDATHDITVELTDELLNAEAPVITPMGFESEVTVPVLAQTDYAGNLKFNVVAHAKIVEAILTISNYDAPYLNNHEIDLCKATSQQIGQLEADGIVLKGFTGSLSDFAQLDVTGLCRNLPANKEYVLELRVKDGLQQVNENSVKLYISSEGAEIGVMPVGKALFGNEYADLRVTFNGPDPTASGKNPFSFKVMGDNGLEDVEIISRAVENNTRSAAFPAKTYIYRISLPYADTDTYPVNMYFNNAQTASGTTEVELEYPHYTVEYDAFAKKIRCRVASVEGFDINNPAKRELFSKRLRVGYENGSFSECKNLSKNFDSGIIDLNVVFSSSQQYNLYTTLKASKSDFNTSDYQTDSNVLTETETQIQNGNFSEIDNSKQINITSINTGGEYTVTFIFTADYQNYSSIKRDVPSNWATLNDFTCYKDSKNKNTWFMEPSTFVENGVVTIRSVGYHHNGTSPKKTGGLTTNYFNTNSPDELLSSVGELFLGSYSFANNVENRKDGIAFKTRPTKLTFDYSFLPYRGEKGYVEIKVKDQAGKVISSANSLLNENSEFIEFSLDLSDYDFKSEANTLEILFRSSENSVNPNVYIPSGDELKEPSVTGGNFTTTRGRTINTNEYKAYAKGSELKIRNVRLEY